jgi:hypothetical protein
VLPEGLTYQCGTISFHSPCRPIRGLQKTFIENNLDCFHMWTLFHSILHTHRPERNGPQAPEDSGLRRVRAPTRTLSSYKQFIFGISVKPQPEQN